MNTEYKNEKELIASKLDEKFAKRVEERFRQKSVIRAARLLAVQLKSWSWIANAVSFLLAIYAVYYFTSLYPGWKFAALLTMGVLMLAAWEYAKRKSIIAFSEGLMDHEKRGNLMLGFVVVALIAGSTATTYYGGNKIVTEENSGPEKVHTPAIDSLSTLIAKAEADKDLMKKQTWQGTIVRDARKQMTILQTRIDTLIAQKLRLEEIDRGKNGDLEQEHESKMANLGIVFGCLGVIMDAVLFGFLFVAEKKEWEVFCLTQSRSKQPDNRSYKRSNNRPQNRSDNNNKRSGRTDKAQTDATDAQRVAAQKRSIGFIKDVPSDEEHSRSCLNCGTDISHKRSDAKYCDKSCRKTFWENKNLK